MGWSKFPFVFQWSGRIKPILKFVACFCSNRYAAKENDIWIRALFKDLTIEAGSGLIILDPVDISGGYTSVKDKTNISVISTDIYIHLSISVISLVLNLQNQAAAALQFGNADLLSPCTHFDQVWVSPKGASYVLADELCSIMLASCYSFSVFLYISQSFKSLTRFCIDYISYSSICRKWTFEQPYILEASSSFKLCCIRRLCNV